MIQEKEKINNLIKGFETIIMYRAKIGNKRAYVKTKPFKVYSGLTGALSAATFKGNADAKRLDTWRMSMVRELGSQERQESYLNSMADFGTLAHLAIVKINNKKELNWEEEQEQAAEYFVASCTKNNIPINRNIIQQQVDEYCKTAASILQFVYDNVMDIHVVEGMCYNDELAIATPVDIVATIKTKQGDKRMSINLKTSEQFNDHHREQVALERYLWNSTYPDFMVKNTALLRGKNWSKKKGIPTYEFEVLDGQTESDLLQYAVKRLLLAKSDESTTYDNVSKFISIFSGVTKLGEVPKLVTVSLEDFWGQQQ